MRASSNERIGGLLSEAINDVFGIFKLEKEKNEAEKHKGIAAAGFFDRKVDGNNKSNEINGRLIIMDGSEVESIVDVNRKIGCD